MRIFSKTKKQIFLLTLASISAFICILPSTDAWSLFDNVNDTSSVIYCQSGDTRCSLQGGTNIIGDKGPTGIRDIEKDRKFSIYIQDVVVYLMSFLGIVGVLYIIYAGAKILTSGGNEEEVKKSKTIIAHVIIGLILIFLAYSIVIFFIGKDGK